MTPADGQPSGTHAPAGDERTLPLAAEQLHVGIEEQVTGQVRVSTHTETHEQRVEQVLRTTTADVVRVPVDREIREGEPVPEVRIEAGVTIVPVMEERLVVEKRWVLVEEIRIACAVDSERVSRPVTLRRQRVDIERTAEERPAQNATDRF